MAMILAFGSAAQARAGGQDGEIVLRLTLQGPVTPTDTFFVGGSQASDGRILAHGAVCGPPSDLYNGPLQPCEAQTYTVIVTSAVGTTAPVSFTRDTAWDGSAEGGQVLYATTVTVTEDPQVYEFVYDYSLGTLPDTAVPAP
jgi:hypothetical protein